MDKLQSMYKKIMLELEEKESEAPLGVRRDTSSIIQGLSKEIFRWSVKYETLKKVLNDKVAGLAFTRPQVEEVFKIIKDMLEHPDKYENYKSEKSNKKEPDKKEPDKKEPDKKSESKNKSESDK